MELLVLHILARALVPVVCGVVLQRVVVGGVGVGEGHIRRLQVLPVDVIVPIAVDGRGHDIRGISRCNRIIAHCVRDGDLLHQHAPDRVVHRPAVLAGVHLLNKRALAEHDPERPLGAGEGQRAVIAALAVGGDGAGDGHIRFILIGCAVADERQRKGLLTGYANVTQSHRGGVGHGQGDDLFKNGVQGHIRVLGIGIAQTIGRAGLFVDPAGLDEAVHGEGLAAQGESLAVGLDVRHRIAALAAVIGDGVLRRLRRRAEGTEYLELNRHTVSGCNQTIFRRLAVHGDSRRCIQTLVVQTDHNPIARVSFEHIGVTYTIRRVVRSVKNEFFPENILNIVFAEGDARDRGFEAVGAVGRRFAHLEAVDRDGEAALHLIDGVKGHVAEHRLDGVIGLIDRPGDALLPAHEFVGRAVLDVAEVDAKVRVNAGHNGARFIARIAIRAVLEILRDRIVVIRKGRHWAEHQHHAQDKHYA